MTDDGVIKNYQNDEESLILDTVKKYPLYSVDKLANLLPNFSRHKIQNVLENNHLSTVAERLAFTNQKPPSSTNKLASLIANLFPKKKIALTEIKSQTVLPTGNQPEKFVFPVRRLVIKGGLIKAVGLLVVLLFVFWQAGLIIVAKAPAMIIDQPIEGFKNEGQKLFVKGKVTPAGASVTVNGHPMALNGDGSFTGTTDIPQGESILKFEATYLWKKSQLVRLVNRLLTKEELELEAKAEAHKKQQAIDKVAQLDQSVNDILAAKNANSGLVKIINNHIQDNEGFSTVVGEVTNLSQKDVSWVMITANFFDQNGTIIDTKYGFATDFTQIMKPKTTAKFETQATNKTFSYYKLSVTWEEGNVAGVSVKTEEAKQATAPAVALPTPLISPKPSIIPTP
ncbi:MAG: FxLYD domain-containing protein [Candidatus Gottesmanbacteria bacterium]